MISLGIKKKKGGNHAWWFVLHTKILKGRGAAEDWTKWLLIYKRVSLSAIVRVFEY